MLQDYTNMPTANLMDLLAAETQKFTQLMADKEFSPEYEESKNIIQQIQAAINSRKETTITGSNISFTQSNTTS